MGYQEPIVYISPWFVILCFLICISLNIAAQVVYSNGREATSGYAYPYIQPDGTTFAVWGVIYFLQAIFVISQLVVPSIRNDRRVILARPGIVMNFLLNGAWLWANAGANTGKTISSYWMATAILFANLAYLYIGVYWYLGVETQDDEPRSAANNFSQRWFFWRSRHSATYRWAVWYPFSANLSWVVVASALNFSTTVFNYDWLAVQETTVGGPDWSIGVALVATLLAIQNAVTKQDLAYAAVAIWALWGVYRNQTYEDSPFPKDQVKNAELANATLLCIGLICLGLLIGWTYNIIAYYQLSVWVPYAKCDDYSEDCSMEERTRKGSSTERNSTEGVTGMSAPNNAKQNSSRDVTKV